VEQSQEHPHLVALDVAIRRTAKFAQSLVGLDFDAAERAAATAGYVVEKITADTVAITTDLRVDRIRCWVDDLNIIIKVTPAVSARREPGPTS